MMSPGIDEDSFRFESRYTTNKGVLPITLVQDMRQAFIRCELYLCTVQEKTVNKKEMLLEMWREQARLLSMNIYSQITARTQTPSSRIKPCII